MIIVILEFHYVSSRTLLTLAQTIMSEATIWVKNPLAIFAKNSDSGVVIKGQEIIELVGLEKLHCHKLMRFMMPAIVSFYRG